MRAYGFPGIRQTHWIRAKHQIVVAEVVNQVRCDDAIARTAWPIELHDAPEGFVWETFGEHHVHYVPLSAMISPEADNLVAVSRCIDGDPAALSSVRVMGPCMAQGMAAAHVLDLAGSGSVHQIDIAASGACIGQPDAHRRRGSVRLQKVEIPLALVFPLNGIACLGTIFGVSSVAGPYDSGDCGRVSASPGQQGARSAAPGDEEGSIRLTGR